jgi:hypothetical protein
VASNATEIAEMLGSLVDFAFVLALIVLCKAEILAEINPHCLLLAQERGGRNFPELKRGVSEFVTNLDASVVAAAR